MKEDIFKTLGEILKPGKMEDLSITHLLSKYQHQQPKNFGDDMERQYPVSAVIEIIRELKQVKNITDEQIELLAKQEYPSCNEDTNIEQCLGDKSRSGFVTGFKKAVQTFKVNQ